MSLRVCPSRVTSSSRPVGYVEPQPVGAAGDLGGAAPVALDGAQRGAGEEVADDGGDRERAEAGEGELEQELAQRLVAVVAAYADDQVVAGRARRAR